MLATPAIPPAAVLHYSVVNKLRLKRCAHDLFRRGDSSCQGRPFDALGC